MDDPYQTLGVARDASQDDIRRAFRKLAKAHHPDLNPGNAQAEARFKAVTAANEILSDPEKRARFDRGEIDAQGQERPQHPSYRDYAEAEPGRRYGPSGPQQTAWNAEDIESIFGTMFGAGARPRTDSPLRGQDERYTLPTGFLDAVNGATTRLTLPDGRTLDVRIPPGTEDGQILRLRGQGTAGWNGGPSGDALIEIHIAPHPIFRRDGNDIRLDLPVTLAEAVLGGPVEIPTPGGKVRMRVPPHSDTGTELRLRGRGVPAHAGQSEGDLYATLRVVVGQPDAALEAFLRDWKPEHPANPRAAMEPGP
ncbi:J domain-containing protein [Acidiphilium sp. AL]|uniref:J domain-containing protein n=1 Tax=Acidiphilium sp. AL TaxID=2871704 RepID=UPI0021CAFB58|nr:J domain-containing protein [Acidiphilium sp. AL]MCU4159863.1 J domain-containing protein [Acidiphilium sp. AL]